MYNKGKKYDKVYHNGKLYNKAFRNSKQILGSSSILDGAELYLPLDSPDNRVTMINNPSFVQGKKGNALSFNGINQYATLNNYDIESNSITYGGWVYIKSLPADFAGLIGKSIAGGTSGRYGMSINLENGSQNIMSLIQIGSNVYLITDSTPVSNYTNTWVQIVSVINKTDLTIKLYINGVEKVGTSITDYSNLVSGGKFFLATYGDVTGQNPTSYYANANIDEVFFMRKALTGTEIMQLYNEY